MVAKLEALDNRDTIRISYDLLELKQAVEGLTFKKDDQKFHTVALHLAIKRFYCT